MREGQPGAMGVRAGHRRPWRASSRRPVGAALAYGRRCRRCHRLLRPSGAKRQQARPRRHSHRRRPVYTFLARSRSACAWGVWVCGLHVKGLFDVGVAVEANTCDGMFDSLPGPSRGAAYPSGLTGIVDQCAPRAPRTPRISWCGGCKRMRSKQESISSFDPYRLIL